MILSQNLINNFRPNYDKRLMTFLLHIVPYSGVSLLTLTQHIHFLQCASCDSLNNVANTDRNALQAMEVPAPCFVCLMPGNCSSFQQGKKIILTSFSAAPRRQCALCVKYLSLWHLDLPFKDDIFQNWHFFICFLEATKLFFDIPVSVLM